MAATTRDPDLSLFNAVTEFDRRASKRKGYNPYALGHYAKALQEVRLDVAAGATLRQALLVNFNGRLLDCLLKSIGEPLFTPDERFAVRTWHREDDSE